MSLIIMRDDRPRARYRIGPGSSWETTPKIHSTSIFHLVISLSFIHFHNTKKYMIISRASRWIYMNWWLASKNSSSRFNPPNLKNSTRWLLLQSELNLCGNSFMCTRSTSSLNEPPPVQPWASVTRWILLLFTTLILSDLNAIPI